LAFTPFDVTFDAAVRAAVVRATFVDAVVRGAVFRAAVFVDLRAIGFLAAGGVLRRVGVTDF
jgi:hypothetical protein